MVHTDHCACDLLPGADDLLCNQSAVLASGLASARSDRAIESSHYPAPQLPGSRMGAGPDPSPWRPPFPLPNTLPPFGEGWSSRRPSVPQRESATPVPRLLWHEEVLPSPVRDEDVPS